MAKHSLKLLFLRKYRTSKKLYKQLKLSNRPLIPTATVGGNPEDGRHEHELQSQRLNGGVDGGAHHIHETPVIRRKRRPQNNQPVDTVDCCLLICECIAQNKLRTFVFVIVAGLMSTSGLYLYNQSLLQYRVYREDVFSPKHGIRLKRCSLPNLKPFSSAVRPFIYYNSRPNCANEQSHSFMQLPPYILKNGSFLVRNVDREQSDGCCYRPFFRNGENNFWRSKSCHDISNNEVTAIPANVEYLELLCINSATETDFRDGIALIPRKETVEDRVSVFDEITMSQDTLSVVILGLDATSRMNFIRAMPQSSKYLLKELSAVSLNGYTKVAENTLPNVIPLLTGKTLDEFKQLCVDESATASHIHLDDCPFIWKTFATNGFRTSLAEDDVNIGIFNMNWAHAFARPPTDYYLRPFSVLMQRHHSFKNGYCYGPSLSFEKLLENARTMAEVFQSEPYFQFIWSTKLSHDDFNKMRWGDEPLLNFLKNMHSNNYLNNTALFVVGDHGSRLDKIRSTAQGKIEDRMPVAYLALPEWFRTKYNKSYENLKQNSDRITSAFDIHKTLYEFINLRNLERFEKVQEGTEGDESEIITLRNNDDTVSLANYRGSSLFRQLPQNRTCYAAGVPLHWCVCHKKIPQDTDSDAVKSATEFVVATINILLQGLSSCATLTLHSIDEVSKWDPSEIIREGCEDNNNATLEGLSSCGENDTDVMVLQVAFTVKPSDATFETTVIGLEGGGWKVTEDVVRTNSYEGQSACVEQKLKPYCYCTSDESIFGGLF